MNNFFPVHNEIISKESAFVNLQRDLFISHNSLMDNLAKRLSESRLEKGWSQAELAKKAGLKNQSNIANLESGHRKNSAHIPAIAEALGIESLWLSEGKGPKYKSEITSESELLNVLGLSKGSLSYELIERIRLFLKKPTEEQVRLLSFKELKLVDRRKTPSFYYNKKKDRRRLVDRRQQPNDDSEEPKVSNGFNTNRRNDE